MKEWDNFHDYAGARAHSEKWYNLVKGHNEELAPAADFRRQRTEKRAHVARKSREVLEKSRRIRDAKEKQADLIQAELERARAEEKAAMSRGNPALGPTTSPAKELRPSRQKRGHKPETASTPEDATRPLRAPPPPAAGGGCLANLGNTGGASFAGNPVTCPGAQDQDPLNPFHYRQRHQTEFT